MAQLADQNGMIFAEEALIVDAQLFLHNLMEEKGISRSRLASLLGVSKARVSQIFSDECENMTLRLLARAAFALGERVELDCEHFRDSRIAAEIKSIAANDDTNVHSIWERQSSSEGTGKETSKGRLNSFIDHSLQTLEVANG